MTEKLRHVIYHMGNPAPDAEERAAVSMHPARYFSSIGLTFDKAEPNSFQECWHLFGVAGMPTPMPSWFTVVAV